ncbi:hypothetical protein [Roseateles terrae]|uniref:Uncharacterized protein n=1 Tax=Roseateles terrae TaxID=431060 RepID=A0ABR6GZE9_9BURK|nr:hypothetical protein [Roseateles terrae]MBB3197052.1 hypothetical protein [Roseateles terrae]OWQ84217.1 hypothetical protein CDN98_19735 [Roseateles terrae]
MFSPSVASFASQSRDYYTPRAFETPAATVAPPTMPPEWCSYEGRDDVRSLAWLAFRASSLFRLIQRQWLDRVHDCDTFAARHCTDQEMAQALSGLSIFRDRLIDYDGEAYFGHRLPLLYSAGKRAMDHICLRLGQDELPLHFRRTQLLEMAKHLELCMSAGPAFIQAAEALDVNPEGLHSAVHTLMRARADEAFRTIYLEEQRRTGETFLASMEVHAVNRMRLEYRLPGGDRSDRYSFGPRMFKADHQADHVQRLRQVLAPGEMAVALADRYLAQLNDRLPPEVPRWPARVDLNDHWPKIHAVVQALDLSLAPVSLHSLTEEDEITEAFYWRRDPSLVQRDLLQAMEDKQLTVPRAPVALLTRKDDDPSWTLQTVDRAVFYVDASSRLHPGVVHQPVRSNHLLTLDRARPLPAFTGVPERLLNHFVATQPDQELPRIPAIWLQSKVRMEPWLSRMTPGGLRSWLQTQPGPDGLQLAQLLLLCTELGKGALLQTVLDHGPSAEIARLTALGTSYLPDAIGASDVLQVWKDHLMKSLQDLAPERAAQLFTRYGEGPLIPETLMEGQTDALSALLQLLERAVQCGVIPADDLHTHLGRALPEAMDAGHHDTVAVLGDFLLKAFRQGWMRSDDLLQFLHDRIPDRACAGALLNGHPECLQWYFDWIGRLLAEGALPAEGVQDLVSVLGDEGELMSHHPLGQNRATTLGVYLDGLTRFARQGLLSRDLLHEALSCDGLEESGLLLMVGGLPDEACLHAWRQSLLYAFEQQQISATDVETFLRGSASAEGPFMERLLADPADDRALAAWRATARWLFERNALSAMQLQQLLNDAEPPQAGHALGALRGP